MSEYNCNLMGANFRPEEARTLVKALSAGDVLHAQREPGNQFDPNAIMILLQDDATGERVHIGYVERGLAEELAPLMDEGQDLDITVVGFSGPIKPYLSIDLVEPAD